MFMTKIKSMCPCIRHNLALGPKILTFVYKETANCQALNSQALRKNVLPISTFSKAKSQFIKFSHFVISLQDAF